MSIPKSVTFGMFCHVLPIDVFPSAESWCANGWMSFSHTEHKMARPKRPFLPNAMFPSVAVRSYASLSLRHDLGPSFSLLGNGRPDPGRGGYSHADVNSVTSSSVPSNSPLIGCEKKGGMGYGMGAGEAPSALQPMPK